MVIFKTKIKVINLLIAGAIGFIISIPALIYSFGFAGAGHGIYLPTNYFFGPTFVIGKLLLFIENSHPDYIVSIPDWMIFIPFLFLYSIYGIFLSLCKQFKLRIFPLVAILLIHYVSFIWLTYPPLSEIRYAIKFLSLHGYFKEYSLTTIAVLFLVVGYHICLLFYSLFDHTKNKVLIYSFMITMIVFFVFPWIHSMATLY
jgi:hypothetical protein